MKICIDIGANVGSYAKEILMMTDAKVIAQFIVDNDADFYKEIQAGVQRMNVNWNNDVLDIKCSNEDCGHEYKSQLNVDYSSFFGTRSLRSRNLIS